MGVLLAVVGGTLSIGAAEASAALEPCKRASSGRSCATLAVPLDRSGAVPGTIRLRIERQKAKRSTRPPLFMLAGGPGQSAIDAFDSETVDGVVGTESRSRDIVVMDLRGTGRSGPLACPGLGLLSTKSVDVAACAAKIGPRRDFYSSVDHADDIEAVRGALGAERIALSASSQGTYVAQVYARRYPDRVDRLVLDSVVGPEGIDAFQRSSMAAVPEALESSCGRRCRRFLPDPGATAASVAARLDRGPLKGYLVDGHGRRRPAEIDASGMLDLVVAYPLLADDLPASIASSARGDLAPLLRAQALLRRLLSSSVEAEGSSGAAAIATLCADIQLPWDAAVPLDGRRAAAAAAANALPPSAFAPFGRRTALTSRVLDLCLGWPTPRRPKPVLGPLPDVPALLLAGGADADTPVSDARALQGLLPRAELVVVPGAASGVIEVNGECAGRAVRRFLAGGVAGRCGRGPGDDAGAPPPPPMSLRDLRPRGAKGRAGRTVAAVQMTAVEGFQALLTASFLALAEGEGEGAKGFVLRAGALRSGSYVDTAGGFALRRATHVPGVRVDGRVRMTGSERPRARATFAVTGRAAVRGRLALRGETLTGTLGGRPIRARFRLLERALGIRSAERSVLGAWSGSSGSWAAAPPWWRPS